MPATNTDSYQFQERQKCKEKMDQKLENLPQVCSYFLYDKLLGPSQMRPRTALAYAGDLENFFYYLKERNPLCKELQIKDIPIELLESLTVDDLEEYYKYLSGYTRNGKYYENGPAAKKRKISAVSTFYQYLERKHYLKGNPCKLLDEGRIIEEPIIALTAAQQNAYLDEIELDLHNNSERSKRIRENYTKLRNIAIIYFFLGTGVRVSELVGVDMSDIDLENESVYITRKGNKHAILSFGPEVTQALKDYIEYSRPKMMPGEDSPDANALFFSMKKRRITVRQVENIVKDPAKIVFGDGTKICCHKLRSTHGTILLASTNDISLVAEQLGHFSIETTKRRYTLIEDLREIPQHIKIRR